MKINFNELEDIQPTKGGSSKASLVLIKSGYIRWNSSYMKENEEFERANSVNIKATKKNKKIIIAFRLLKDKTGKFSINSYKNKKGDVKSKSFSARSIFKQLGLSYKDYAQKKSIELKPEIQDFEGKRYFIVELDE